MDESFWLNVDKPSKRSTLHKASCSHIARRRMAKFKGVGEMGRDGGWFACSNIEQAKARAKKEGKGYEFIECSFCRPEHESKKFAL